MMDHEDVRRLLILLLLGFTLSGCGASLVIYDDDSALLTTGKVVARTTSCILTFCLSEIGMEQEKKELEARPLIMASGSHEPKPPRRDYRPSQRRFVVWGDRRDVVSHVTQVLQADGQTVVERDQLDQVLAEQKLILLRSSDLEADLLHVGRLMGADRVAFAEATIRPTQIQRCVFCPLETAYFTSVSVRAVKIESGSISWAGTAQYNQPIRDPEVGLGYLTRIAIDRAICPFEWGAAWIEASPYRRRWGCQLPPP